jgi:hypothetical protein
MGRGNHAKSVASQILRRLQKHPIDWVFTPSDLSDLGTRNAVASALKRHKKAGLIRQIARGLYDRPRRHSQFGILAPELKEVEQALKRRDAIRLQPTGAYAANLLHLSTQVPMRVVYLTDGPARRLRIGKTQIVLRRTTPRNMATAGTASGLVIQALRWLGKNGDHSLTVPQLKKVLSIDDRRKLVSDARYAPAWIAKIMREVAMGVEVQK